MSSKSGYRLDRDDGGLTNRERQVVKLMRSGVQFVEIGEQLGITKQRVNAIVNSLVKKGAVVKTEAGNFAVVVK